MTIDIISFGPCYLSACSDEPVEEVEKKVNISHPTGVSSKWKLSEDKTFKGGEPHPKPCETVQGRTHYLFECKSTMDAVDGILEALS